jgi:hypothetical protein
MTFIQLGVGPEASERKKLELAVQLLEEVLAGDEQPHVRELESNGAAPTFDSRCKKCGQPILWAPTESGRMVALDQRPGPYILSEDGTAIWQAQGGLAYHYDGTPEGCPKQQASAETIKQDDPPRRREWQDIYD